LGMEAPRVRATRGQVMGDSFNGREVRRLMIKA